MKNRKIELLAPAGSMETLKAAVQAGADAVYLAGPKFGARQSAENFTHETLKEAIDYCHIRGVKVYGAINTLIKTQEMQSALDEISFMYSLQIDAVILQDWGLVDQTRELFPDLELHGSTQMSLYDATGVEKAMEMGLKRVVIARETPLEAIHDIIMTTGAEIEAFVHGALCYSYSGQCLMSSQIGGRSGNRGRCAQPCRRKYMLRQGSDGAGKLIKDAYPLSTRDLLTLDHLDKLVESGIASLKIEGRLRKSDYVAAVVSAYRQELDRILDLPLKAVHGAPGIQGVFNRETTSGRILNALPVDVLTTKGPGNMGQLIGKTSGYDRYRKQLLITLSGNIRTGDGVKVLAGNDEPGAHVNGLFIEKEKVQKAGPGQRVAIPFDTWVPEGCEVRKTLDLDVGKEAQQFSETNQRKVLLTAGLHLQVGEKASLWVQDSENHRITVTTEQYLEPAQNQGADEERIMEQIRKTGDTPYMIETIDMHIDPKVFIPVKVLNNLRRDALEQLDALRTRIYSRVPAVNVTPSPLHQKMHGTAKAGVAVTVSGLEQLKVLKGLTIQRVDYTDLNTLKEAIELSRTMNLPLCPAVPALTGLRDIESTQEILQEAGWMGPVRIGNLGQTGFSRTAGDLIGDHTLNLTNPWSLAFCLNNGITSGCLSPELSRDELLELAKYSDTELLVYGRLTVMTSPLCPVQCGGPCLEKGGQRFTLEDEKGFVFPAKCRDGLFEVMNSRVLNLIDAVSGLPVNTFSRFRLDFDMERPEMVRRITQGFLSVLAGYAKPRDTDAAFKSELHTAGAFKNGIE